MVPPSGRGMPGARVCPVSVPTLPSGPVRESRRSSNGQEAKPDLESPLVGSARGAGRLPPALRESEGALRGEILIYPSSGRGGQPRATLDSPSVQIPTGKE